MSPRILFILGCIIFAAPAAFAQTTQSAEPSHPEEQNEVMRDTLKKMQIKREEDDHRKLLEKGTQIKDEVEALSKETGGQVMGRLSRNAEKKLKEIEKLAKQIRSESGGGQDEPMESTPQDGTDALKRLKDTCERLNTNLSKTSRQIVSIAVVSDATQIIELVKYLRGYLN